MLDDSAPALHEKPYKWVLHNLHNPYPSLATKKSLAKESDISVKLLSDWLSNIRRRIGWNAFSNQYFKGDRALTIDCAQRILLEDVHALPYSQKIMHDFLRVKEAAERLYDGKVAQSELAMKLGVCVLATSPGPIKKRKTRSSGSPLPSKKVATLTRNASGVSTASSATLLDFDTDFHLHSSTHVNVPSRKRGGSSVWLESLADSDVERQQVSSRFKRRRCVKLLVLFSFHLLILSHRESISSSATGPSCQPTLITSSSSFSGTSTPAPTTPILYPTSLGYASQPATSSQNAHLSTLIDDWLSSVKTGSPASALDELPTTSSKKRRNEEQDEREALTMEGPRAKKARVASEASTSSTAFEDGTFAPPPFGDAYYAPAEGLYPLPALDTFPANLPYDSGIEYTANTDTNAEALYTITSALDFAPSGILESDLLSGNDFGGFNTVESAVGQNLGLGLGHVGEDQALEVGVGAYGFDFSGDAGLDFGFGMLPPAPLDLSAGADLASVLQQLHPPTNPTLSQEQFALPAVAPEAVPLPRQEVEEVAALSSTGASDHFTLALSEEEMAAFAGCLNGNPLDLSEDVFGLNSGLDASFPEVPSSVSAPFSAAMAPTDISACLPPVEDMATFERDAKLSRLQSLLAEVNQLQHEVFC